MKMKMYWLLLPMIALLWAGCKKDDGEPQANKTLKLVDKITWIHYYDDEEYEGSTMSFTYDASNRITKMNQEFEDFDPLTGYGYRVEVTFSYAGNQVTIVEKEIEDDDEYNTTSILTLDANGYIVSGTTEVDGETRSVTATYDNGYLKSTAYENDEHKTTNDFVWSGGNLTRVTETFYRDEISAYTSVIKYGSQSNHPNCNFNFNMMIVSNETINFSMLPMSAPNFGFYGKLSDKLMVESTNEDGGYTDKRTYAWELDSEGFVTKVTETVDYYDSSYTVYTITYKN